MHKIWSERAVPDKYMHLLQNKTTIIGAASDTPDAPLAALGQAQAIIAGSDIDYDAALMDQAPDLQVIARTGIGLDNVAVAEATARGVAVCNTPNAPTIATAEHTLALMFAVAKRLKWLDHTLQRGEKIDYFSAYGGFELYGARLGLVGLGRIGSRVAALAQGIGMTVAGFDPHVSTEQARQLEVDALPSLKELLPLVDVLSLHVPRTPETTGLMNAERLALMKPGAILINAARGGLVDEQALLQALESGHLRGAGLDVFEVEPPPPDHPLLARDDVVATPHVASATGPGKDRLWEQAIVQALQALDGERPRHLVNPEVWPVNRA